MPAAVGAEIAAAHERLRSALPLEVVDLASADVAGYFKPVQGRWSDLLEDANVLGIPASSFGSSRDDITVLSSLGFLENPLRVETVDQRAETSP